MAIRIRNYDGTLIAREFVSRGDALAWLTEYLATLGHRIAGLDILSDGTMVHSERRSGGFRRSYFIT